MANARISGTAGLILAGGQSSRMGRDKGGLRVRGESLLERGLRRMRAVADPVLVAVSPERERLPGASPLPPGVIAVPDRSAFEGPLVGLAEGFRRLRGEAERVLVMPVDLPFCTEPWLARLAEGLHEHPAVLYSYEGFQNALTAGYRLSLLDKLEHLVAEGARRPIALAQGESPLVLTLEDLWREGDGPPPLMDVDRPEDYRDALRWEGLGDARGTAAWVKDAARGIEVPLWASTPAQALDYAAVLYPGHVEPWAAARARPVARVNRDESTVSIPWDARLLVNDVLILDR
jgi:molybdopterin-guanine dinucleotide biosynthesis protein A